MILRVENLLNLPKSTATLLQTKSYLNIKSMKSSKNTNSCYVYFGIEEELKAIITDEYTENTIRLLFNIDGLPLYDCSNEQFWVILGLVLHNQYECQPFIVAVYSENSKPQNVNEYLQDFVEEANSLVQNFIIIGQRVLKVEIIGISCDTPARSFIKKYKNHGGFYACERCEIRSKTKNKRRIYPNMNSKQRTEDSFRRQQQKEHHLEGRSPLTIPHFDLVSEIIIWIIIKIRLILIKFTEKSKIGQASIDLVPVQ